MSNILYGYSQAQKTLKGWKKKRRKSKEKLVRRKKEQNRDKRRKLLRNSRNSNSKGQRGFVLKKKLQAESLFQRRSWLSLLEDTKMAMILQQMSSTTHGCKYFIPQKARLQFPVSCTCMNLPTTSTNNQGFIQKNCQREVGGGEVDN